MKKLFIILIMLVYGLSSSGMVISLHYCCGKLDDVSFSGKNHRSDCPMGSKIKKSSCCNDKQISTKLNADQQAAIKWIQLNKQTLSAPENPAFPVLFTGFIIAVDRLARGTPATSSVVPLFIKNCVFRI